MLTWRQVGTAIFVSLVLYSASYAASTSVEMLREMFQRPITEWKQLLGANRRFLNEEFFSNIDKRVRWGIENNHIDDAFRFSMVGDFAAEVVNRPANYRVDLADLFFKAENDLMAGQIVDNIIITSSGTPQAYRAQLIRGLLKEKEKDLYGAYLDYVALTKVKYRLDETWYRCGLISEFIGEITRAKEEYGKAVAAGNNGAAAQRLERIVAQEKGDWDQIPPLPNADNDKAMVNTSAISTSSTGSTLTSATGADSSSSSSKTGASSLEQVWSKARLQAASGQLVDASETYSSIFDPSNLELARDYAAVYYRMGELEKARKIYDKALAAHPDGVELLRGRANTLERLYDRNGDRKALAQAVADYSKALKLAPSDLLLDWEIQRVKAKSSTSS